MSVEDKTSGIGRVQSTVSFREVDSAGAGGVSGEEDSEDEENSPILVDSTRTRVFSVSKDRPITRIPTRVEMKTLTHKAKRPAIDVEFHDLTYAVNTTAGNSVVYVRPLYSFSCVAHATEINIIHLYDEYR